MALELTDGYEAVGHLIGLEDSPTGAHLRLDSKGALVYVPQRDSVHELFEFLSRTHKEKLPELLRFRSSDGMLALIECVVDGGSISSTGTGLTTIRAGRVVRASSEESTFARVSGLRSDIDGLANWVGMHAINTSFTAEQGVLKSISVVADRLEDVVLGGALDARVQSSFWYEPNVRGGIHQVTDIAALRTVSSPDLAWNDHAVVHRMFQDLMCLVYGKPCLIRVSNAAEAIGGSPQQRLAWSETYEPTFGRTGRDVSPLSMRDRPLFSHGDTDVDAVRSWMAEWDLWSRPTWIAVTTMFQKGTTVEARLLQVGVALESLGHSIWASTSSRPSRPHSFSSLVGLVTQAVEIEHERIYGDNDRSSWIGEFNRAFKGVKHADNPLPDSRMAHVLSNQGMNLIRAWLGRRLGVEPGRLKECFDQVR